jgi:GNAT superfamily N-acetyltransferase
MISVVQFSEWPAAEITELLAESEQEGFRFVRRAQDEWLLGVNRFSQEGEALFGVFEHQRLLAIGGVSRDSGGCGSGRLRRLYVRRAARRRWVGKRLVLYILSFVQTCYLRVVLRCDTDAADQFYRGIGFSRTDADDGVTHVIELKKE